MDHTLINLISLIITGVGLFTAVTKFSVPELNSAFYGHNPFAIKRDVIEKIMTRIFTGFAILGLIIPAIAEILGCLIPERVHSIQFYFSFFFIGIISVIFVTMLLSKIGRILARREWHPLIIKSQKDAFEAAMYITEHNGLHKEASGATISEEQKERNLKSAEEHIAQIEKLLELDHQPDMKARIARLKPLFN